MKTVGVLALQGAFALHAAAIERCGAVAREVRLPPDLDGVDGMVLPGGESTTMSLLLGANGLTDPLRDGIGEGLPVFGTCAGMILLAAAVEDGRPDQVQLARLPITVRRNGYGRQLASFEADISVADAGIGPDDPFRAVFIRAPLVVAAGDETDVLAAVDGSPVLVGWRNLLAAAFHPELTDDLRLHRRFVESL